MIELFKKTRRNPDYTVRCYLTLRCDSMCSFCSAQIPQVSPDRKNVESPPEAWAEGLNRRARYAILAGGEPFQYSGFCELVRLLKGGYKIEIYTNLQQDVSGFVRAAQRPYQIVVSLHPATPDLEAWRERVEILAHEGHSLRLHIVRTPGYEKLVEFLADSGITGRYSIALQGDQRSGPKSGGYFANKEHPLVECTSRIFLFGPDGCRYHCVHKMVTGDEAARFGHISQADYDIQTQMQCREFGYCAGCDNNIEGAVCDVTEGQ